MKIKDMKVFVCCPGRNFITVKIVTEDGIFGLGDATLNGREMVVVSYLEEHIVPCLIGRDAHQIEDIWQYLYKGAYWQNGAVRAFNNRSDLFDRLYGIHEYSVVNQTIGRVLD